MKLIAIFGSSKVTSLFIYCANFAINKKIQPNEQIVD